MSTIIEKAREIVAVNGMSDKITLLQGKMEEVELPFPKVDIIISEWMGYFLLYESMLDTVLYARDKYLNRETGLIFPDKATIFMAGIEDGEYKEEKIGCESLAAPKRAPLLTIQFGTTFGASTTRLSKPRP
jgi:protein arginine N-methyltransferase 1